MGEPYREMWNTAQTTDSAMVTTFALSADVSTFEWEAGNVCTFEPSPVFRSEVSYFSATDSRLSMEREQPTYRA